MYPSFTPLMSVQLLLMIFTGINEVSLKAHAHLAEQGGWAWLQQYEHQGPDSSPSFGHINELRHLNTILFYTARVHEKQLMQKTGESSSTLPLFVTHSEGPVDSMLQKWMNSWIFSVSSRVK